MEYNNVHNNNNNNNNNVVCLMFGYYFTMHKITCLIFANNVYHLTVFNARIFRNFLCAN